jgi:hypothetical protein
MAEIDEIEKLRDSLIEELEQRRPLVDLYDAYMQGRHICGFHPAEERQVADMISAVADNWCETIVLAATERMDVQGLILSSLPRVEDDPLREDFSAWDLWRRNGLDEDSPLLFDTAVTHGEAYLLVWPDEDDQEKAQITVEHPAQMVVRYSPHNRRKIIAALKLWIDEDERETVYMWTPGGLHRWRRNGGRGMGLEPIEDLDFSRNPFASKVVPVFPLINRPQARPAPPPGILLSSPHHLGRHAIGLGRSDLANVISTQDEINHLLRAMLVAAEYQAFQQRWVIGLEREDEDPDDEESVGPPFIAGPGNLWEGESPDMKFGAFPAADLSMFLNAMENRRNSMASRSNTPAYYFGGGNISNVSEGGLKALDTGLVARIRNKFRPYGGGMRRAIMCALTYEQPDLAGAQVDVDWADPESRTEAQHVDAGIKKIAAGVPPQQIWEDLGYSPEQIARFRSWALQNATEDFLLNLNTGPQELTAGTVADEAVSDAVDIG